MLFVGAGDKSRGPERADVGMERLDGNPEPEETSATTRGSDAGAGQTASHLLARSADVHVDFHAHLHFDDLRSFPGHSGLPSDLAQPLRRLNRKTAMRLAQEAV